MGEPSEPLHTPWPDEIIPVIGEARPDCTKCCTRETGGDLCESCGHLFDLIADLMRGYAADMLKRAEPRDLEGAISRAYGLLAAWDAAQRDRAASR